MFSFLCPQDLLGKRRHIITSTREEQRPKAVKLFLHVCTDSLWQPQNNTTASAQLSWAGDSSCQAGAAKRGCGRAGLSTSPQRLPHAYPSRWSYSGFATPSTLHHHTQHFMFAVSRFFLHRKGTHLTAQQTRSLVYF